MSKTNFKCMFLIDDKLYNKAILREGANESTNISVPMPTSSHIVPIPNNQMSIDRPKGDMNTPEGLKLSEELGTINNSDKVDNAEKVKIDLSHKGQQTEIPSASASTDNTDLLQKSGNNDDMEIDQNRIEEEDCECYETHPKASSSQKMQIVDYKRKSARKLTTMKPLPAQAKRKLTEEDDDLSDDSDWEKLRQRYRRLREESDSPPRKKENFDHVSAGEVVDNNKELENKSNISTLLDRKNEDPISKFESISFICSICKENFRKRNTLHRHIMNWHSEYFEDPSLRNKRKKSEEDNRPNKKFRGDGRKKRNMPQNQPNQKYARTEFPCTFCQRFFKTKYALERHNSSIHGTNRGSKRAKNGNEARYVKRQKVNDKPAVTYLSYF